MIKLKEALELWNSGAIIIWQHNGGFQATQRSNKDGTTLFFSNGYWNNIPITHVDKYNLAIELGKAGHDFYICED
jgi:hypothetical protein